GFQQPADLMRDEVRSRGSRHLVQLAADELVLLPGEPLNPIQILRREQRLDGHAPILRRPATIRAMPKSLQSFLAELREQAPEELLDIEKRVDPDTFDVTAILEHLT